MPRKMRVPKMRSRRLTLADLDLVAELCLLSAWSPPKGDVDRERSRWETWQEFLEDYIEVRSELLAAFGDRFEPGDMPFAERVRLFVENYGMAALEEAGYEELHSYPEK